MGIYYTSFGQDEEYQYPEDMATIIAYLRCHGQIHVPFKKIDELYHNFSEEEYCAGWMHVDEDILKEFEQWLDKQ